MVANTDCEGHRRTRGATRRHRIRPDRQVPHALPPGPVFRTAVTVVMRHQATEVVRQNCDRAPEPSHKPNQDYLIDVVPGVSF